MTDSTVYKFGNVFAIRFGDENGDYDEGALARVAQFVLGLDVDTRVTALNERLLSVITPVEEFWDPDNGLADIVVTHNQSGLRLALGLGQWLARYPSGQLRPMPHNVVVAKFFPEPPEESFDVELENLITKHNREQGSGTPPAVLAKYLIGCLSAYNLSVQKRAQYRGETV